MKKTCSLILIVLTIASFAYAEPKMVSGEIIVSADNYGRVTVSGSSAGELDRMTQFCTDEINLKYGCPNNVEIMGQGNTYQLDISGLKEDQKAFNFHFNGSNVWLWIPRKNVKLGNNVKIVPGEKGHRFVYTGPVPQ